MIVWKIIKEFFLILWQLPQDIIGLFTLLVCKLRKRATVKMGDRIIVEWDLLSGMSLGHFIFVYSSLMTTTVKHEYGHTIQSRYLGWLYLFVVGLPSIVWAGCFGNYRKTHSISYYSFYTEKWADKLGKVQRK